MGVSPPSGVLIVRNYLSKNMCKKIIAYAKTQTENDTGVVDINNTDNNRISFSKDSGRITHQINIDGMTCDILNIFNDVYCNQLASFYNVSFEWYERPQILKYNKGGLYGYHADADHWIPENKQWIRIQDRDYSVLLYLNDNYEGGELHFFHQDYKFKPEAGMLVAFPSHNGFLHAALETTAGTRYAMVSWGAINGSIRTRQMPGTSVYLGQAK